MATLGRIIRSDALARRDRSRGARSKLALGWVGLSGIVTLAMIAAIIGTIVAKGTPHISWSFLSDPPVEGMTSGGIWPMIRGSLLLMLGTLAITPLVGVLGGVWLAEYVGQGRFAQVIRSLITSLAGTPSIVFGLFGLAIFVLKFGLGFSLVAGWLTLAMMSIPVVMLTTEQAMRTVPEPFEQAGTSLGLTQWQTIRKVVLPSAMPGIMTGLVLAAGRAAGEAPPILLTAGLYYSTEKLALSWDTLTRPVANLPYHLAEGYRQGGVIPEGIIWGTCLTLMAFVLLVNLGAILVRARARARQKW